MVYTCKLERDLELEHKIFDSSVNKYFFVIVEKKLGDPHMTYCRACDTLYSIMKIGLNGFSINLNQMGLKMYWSDLISDELILRNQKFLLRRIKSKEFEYDQYGFDSSLIFLFGEGFELDPQCRYDYVFAKNNKIHRLSLPSLLTKRCERIIVNGEY